MGSKAKKDTHIDEEIYTKDNNNIIEQLKHFFNERFDRLEEKLNTLEVEVEVVFCHYK